MTNELSIKAIILLLLYIYVYMSDTECSIEFGYIYTMNPGGKTLKIWKSFIRLCGWHNIRTIIELF